MAPDIVQRPQDPPGVSEVVEAAKVAKFLGVKSELTFCFRPPMKEGNSSSFTYRYFKV